MYLAAVTACKNSIREMEAGGKKIRQGGAGSRVGRGGESVAKEKLAEQLKKEAVYAQKSLSQDLLYEVYGKTKMAYQLEAISKDDFLEINHMTVYFTNTHVRELAEG